METGGGRGKWNILLDVLHCMGGGRGGLLPEESGGVGIVLGIPGLGRESWLWERLGHLLW